LGPSGCGKTTTLRCLAGLEKPDSGEIYLDGKCLTSTKKNVFVPPEKRDMGMVFQSYAIWPHMTVFQNVSYPLVVKHVSKNEIDQKVTEALRLVGLDHLSSRYATQLSGGQQQRVALARSLVFNPAVLLLDEPLSNLDAKLREQMRYELKEIQRKLKVTTVYVTHDQVEAMMLADTIVVMNRGRAEQVGSADDIYMRPASRFVADFIGSMNFIEGVVHELESGVGIVECSLGTLEVPLPSSCSENDKVLIAIRPEMIRIHKQPPTRTKNIYMARISFAAFLGNVMNYQMQAAKGTTLLAQTDSMTRFGKGDPVLVEISPQACTIIKS
jgi:iron(III) transport system ATP-binding protein